MEGSTGAGRRLPPASGGPKGAKDGPSFLRGPKGAKDGPFFLRCLPAVPGPARHRSGATRGDSWTPSSPHGSTSCPTRSGLQCVTQPSADTPDFGATLRYNGLVPAELAERTQPLAPVFSGTLSRLDDSHGRRRGLHPQARQAESPGGTGAFGVPPRGFERRRSPITTGDLACLSGFQPL
jgi:hypothetical protein